MTEGPGQSANAATEHEPSSWMFWSAIAIAPFYVWMVFAFFYESWGLLPCILTAAPAILGAPIAVVDRLKKNARNSSREQTRAEDELAAPPQMRAVWSALAARYRVTEIADHPSGEAWFFECTGSAAQVAIVSAGDEDDLVIEYHGEFWRDYAVDDSDMSALVARAVAHVESLIRAS
jgi:hypothetical protein